MMERLILLTIVLNLGQHVAGGPTGNATLQVTQQVGIGTGQSTPAPDAHDPKNCSDYQRPGVCRCSFGVKHPGHLPMECVPCVDGTNYSNVVDNTSSCQPCNKNIRKPPNMHIFLCTAFGPTRLQQRPENGYFWSPNGYREDCDRTLCALEGLVPVRECTPTADYLCGQPYPIPGYPPPAVAPGASPTAVSKKQNQSSSDPATLAVPPVTSAVPLQSPTPDQVDASSHRQQRVITIIACSAAILLLAVCVAVVLCVCSKRVRNSRISGLLRKNWHKACSCCKTDRDFRSVQESDPEQTVHVQAAQEEGSTTPGNGVPPRNGVPPGNGVPPRNGVPPDHVHHRPDCFQTVL